MPTTATARPHSSHAPDTTRSVVRPRRVASGRLPGWGDLGGEPLARKVGKTEALLGRVSMGRFVLLIAGVVLVFTLWVGHVYRTQEILQELDAARQTNVQLNLRYNRIKAAFDAATSPSVVIPKAQALGLSEGVAYGPAIDVDR